MPQETARASTESRYAKIHYLLGSRPDLVRLQGSETVRQQIAEQKVLEARKLGHPFAEHRAITAQLRQRALDGTCARDGTQRDKPIDATGFRSDEALIAAIVVNSHQGDTVSQKIKFERDYLEARAQGKSERRLKAIINSAKFATATRVERALGTEWRSHIEGYTAVTGVVEPTKFSSSTEIKTVWRMTPEAEWYVLTCYLEP